MHSIKLWLMAWAISSTLATNAQRQYWGYSLASEDMPSNGIFCVDSNAMDLRFVHFFGPSGGAPSAYSSLLLASDGLIYGVVDSLSRDLVFSYDPVVDTFQVRVTLGTAEFPNYGVQVSMTEGEPGVLYLVTQSSPASIFKLYLNDHSLVLAATLPNISGGTTALRSPFVKASNGKLYAARAQGATGIPAASRVVNFDPATGALDWTLYQYPTEDGRHLNGQFIEHNSRLYSTSSQDNFSTTVDGSGNVIPDPRGVIYSCSMGALDHVRHVYFNDTIREPEAGMLEHPNGLWYGMALNSPGFGSGYGLNVLYSYDVSTNTIAFVNKLIPPTPLGSDHVWPGFLLGSNGKFYGSLSAGLFEYDLALDTFQLRAPFFTTGLGRGPNGSMIEICRKPNYKPRPTTSFDVCAGAYFFYDLKNVNATSVVWRRNGNVVPAQTDQLLEFAAITEADEGVWTCTLTNECGVTEPPAITITVNAGTFTTSTISGDTLLCGVGDVVVLSGNNGGTWSTGATTPTLTIAQPGSYYVHDQQACGLSLSNTIEVVHLDSAKAPLLTYQGVHEGVLQVCPDDLPFLIEGNSGGPWGNLPMGIWQDGSAGPTYSVTDTGLVYATNTNACNSDTSGIYEVVIYQGPPIPPVSFTDNFGVADDLLCGNDSVTLGVEENVGFNLWDADGQFLGSLSGGFFPQSYTIDSAGVYYLTNYACTGPTDTLVITIHSDTLPPQAATILPGDNPLTGCDQDTVYIGSDAIHAFWSWTDGNGQQQRDSSLTIQVDWSATAYILTPFNGCGDGPQSLVFIQPTPAPDVQLTLPFGVICLEGGPMMLEGGTPAGGTYSGPGVSGGLLDPVAAGEGHHEVTYSYSDGACTGHAYAMVDVDVCAGIAALVDPGIVVAPNPSDGLFTATIEASFVNGHARLFDAQGAQVGETVRLAQGANQLGRPGLAPGLYVLRVELDGSVYTRPVAVLGR